MWPWEHLAFGYVVYSLSNRLLLREPPTAAAALAVVVATQLPDVVDKPLSWWLGVLPAGRTLAHSLLFAAPLSVAVALLARRAGRPEVGFAFAVAYLSHVVADGFYPMAIGRDAYFGFLLWPVVPAPGDVDEEGLAHLLDVVNVLVDYVLSPAGATYVVLDAILMLVFLGLWVADGAPGT